MKIYQSFIFVFLFFTQVNSQVSPIWVTSNYLQADSKKVIDGDACSCKTGNSSTPTASANFATAFSAIPNLGFGVSNYQGTGLFYLGDDYLGEEMFQINRTVLTTSSFTVKMQIYGYTHLWVVQIRFIAISRSFPHHLNSFDNVPINYTKGPLTNISVNGSVTRSYENIVNYTTQTGIISSTYRYFSLPLTNNKVLIFMTSMYLYSTPDQATPGVNNAIELKVTATPWSTETYRLYATLKEKAYMTRLHFSMIVFDQIDVQASGQYLLIYDRIQFTNAGGFYNFPVQFLTNFMLGFTQFSSARAANALHFIINFVTVSGVHRLQMPAAVPRNPLTPPIIRYNYTIFYLKTWTCTLNTIFDPSIDMCISCPLANCITCFNTTKCLTCNQPIGYFLNSGTGLCQTCNIAGCVTCSTLTTCSDCNQALNYVLSSQTCLQCQVNFNYFADNVTQTCLLCGLSNCVTCFSLTQCQICNSGALYYVGTSGICDYCDPIFNKFIDPITKGCVPCPVLNCATCTSYYSCQTCNIGFLVNISDHLCYICNLSNCLQCSTLTTCIKCSLGYYIDAGNQCQPCTMAGCINCTDVMLCVQCDHQNQYLLTLASTCLLCPTGLFPNKITSTCEPCTLFSCLVCSSLTSCISCNITNNYYLLPTGICGFCDPIIDNFINSSTLNCHNCSISFCLDCLSLALCSQCDTSSNYFLNGSDNLCYFCTINNCQTCSNLTVCSNCAFGYFVNLGTGQCDACTMIGCLNCSDLITCSQCDESSNFILVTGNSTCSLCPIGLFANSSTHICQSCNIFGCLLCTTLTSCGVCDLNISYYLIPGSCNYCDPSLNNFIDFITQTCQPCTIFNCLQCASLAACSSCNASANYYKSLTDQLCYLCSISNCILCSTLTTCSLCDESNQYFVNSTTGLCQMCSIPYCLNCSSLTSCYECDIANNYGFDFTSLNSALCGPCNVSCLCDGYGIPWNSIAQQCTPICGDGLIRANEECDDANNMSSDGCSSNCKIQPMQTCIGQPSFCYYYYYIEGNFISAIKAGCNVFKVTLSTPKFKFEDIKNNIYIYNPLGLNIIRRQKNNEYIDIYVQYTDDLLNQTIYLDFVPGQTIDFTYNPTIPALAYDQSQCQGTEKTQKMMQASQVISYIILLFSLFSCKIVGLELFGVLQLSYFTLSSHDFFNAYLGPLISFRTFNGLNIQIISQSSNLPENMKQMKIEGSFINNCNLMLFLLFGQLLISIIVYVVGKLMANSKVEKIGKKLLKQGFITFVLFNIFNVAFSAGVHWKFANPEDPGYVISSIILIFTLILMVGSVIALEITSKDEYGEFKEKFKDVWICQAYITLSVCYRMALGFYTALRTDYNEGTLLILGFSFAFMMYFITNLPFIDFYQNYRAGLIHLTMLITLVVTNYYRTLKSTTPIEIKAKMHAPAILELVLIVLCIFISFLVLIYEIYRMIKNIRNSLKSKPTDQINYTMQNIHTS